MQSVQGKAPDNRGWRSRHLLIGLLALVAALALAACGSDGGIEGSEVEEVEVSTAESTGDPSGKLYVANWPFYIDRKTVPEYEDTSGVSVKYIEEVNDNAEFFGKVQPLLENGESGDRDVFVVTDWMAKKMYDLGYLQNFDKEAVEPAFGNLRESLQSVAIDPNRDYTIPWQSGMTGIVVDKTKAPDMTSINDLFDPQYKGKVTILTEMRDTIPLLLKADGIEIEDATKEDWEAQIQKLQEAADSGQIRRFTGNGYTRDIANGDIVAAMGWSGDAVQLQADNPDIEFVMPDEGCMLWSDNIVIPIGAPNPTAAYDFINYVYEPDNQAQITAYNNYVQPVEGVREIFEKEDPALAESQLIFPDDEFTADCSTQDAPPGGLEVEQDLERQFQAVITG